MMMLMILAQILFRDLDIYLVFLFVFVITAFTGVLPFPCYTPDISLKSPGFSAAVG
jgi:hypothetical protein